jgi:hypothetical protein
MRFYLLFGLPSMSYSLLELYYALAQLGLGLGGIVYDLNFATLCASRSEGIA